MKGLEIKDLRAIWYYLENYAYLIEEDIEICESECDFQQIKWDKETLQKVNLLIKKTKKTLKGLGEKNV